MRKIWQKKVAAALLCAVLTLGFVSPYDPIRSDFANRQLPKVLLKNYQAWSVGAFWVLPDKETVAFCRQLYMQQSARLQTQSFFEKLPGIPQCDIFGMADNRFVFTISKIPTESIDKDKKPLKEKIYLGCMEKGAGNVFSSRLENRIRTIKIGSSIEIIERKIYDARLLKNSRFKSVITRHDYFTSDGSPIDFYFDLPGLNFFCNIHHPSDFEKSSRDLASTLILLFTDKFRELESFSPAQPKLDTNVYQVVDLPLTAFIHFELLNSAVFKPQKWPGSTSVGGIAASSPEHALGLLSVRLSAIWPFLPAGLPGESVSDSERQKHYKRGDGADALAAI
jgi:hypothetical protein